MADKEGHSRLTQGMDAVVTANAKDDAQASIEKVVQNAWSVHNWTKTDGV